jgi:C4-dicarboxylate-specific signal transduction histidine kinase
MVPLIVAIVAAVAALTAVVLVLLNWDRINDWFQNRQQLAQSDKENIIFTLQERLKDGKYKTVQGIFNKATNELADGAKYVSDNIDEHLAELHSNDELVVYG